jgi:hypothetical protein
MAQTSNKKGKQMKRYAVSYEGWLIIEADDEDTAASAANLLLSRSDLINDGEYGEWLLADITEEENN